MTVAERATEPSSVEAGVDSPEQAGSAAWIGIAVALAAALVYLLAHLLLLRRFPWFVDETIYGTFSQATLGDRGARFVALSDHKGLINAWIAAVFIKLGATPIDGLRITAGLSGLVTGAATGAMVRTWRGPREGLAAGLLALFVPYLFVHSVVGVHDSFVAAGSAIALALQLSLAREPRLDRAMLLGLTFGALLLSKPTGVLTILLLPVSLALFDWGAPRRLARLTAWAWYAAISVVMAGVMFAITRLSPFAYSPAPDNHRTIGEFLADPTGAVSAVGSDVAAAVIGYLTWPIFLAALWGIWCALRRRDRVGIVLTVWSLAAIAAFVLLTTRGYPRYGLQSAAPMCALAVFGGADLLRRIQARWSTRVAAVALVLAVVPALILDLRVIAAPATAPYPGLDHDQYVTAASNVEPDRRAAEEILRRAPATGTSQDPEHKVLQTNGWPWPAIIVLNGRTWAASPRFSVVEPWVVTPADANKLRFVIQTGPDKPDWLDLSSATKVGAWQRPDGGLITTLYDRGPAGG